MKKMVYCCLAALFVLSGCVSTKAHKMVLDESEARLAQLENTKQELEQNKKALEGLRQANEKLTKDINDLASAKDKEIASLKGQIEELSSSGIMTSKAIEELRQEKDQLSASDNAKASEIEGLKQELANTTELKHQKMTE